MHASHMSPDPLLGQGIYHLQCGAHIASNKSPALGKDLATQDYHACVGIQLCNQVTPSSSWIVSETRF